MRKKMQTRQSESFTTLSCHRIVLKVKTNPDFKFFLSHTSANIGSSTQFKKKKSTLFPVHKNREPIIIVRIYKVFKAATGVM